MRQESLLRTVLVLLLVSIIPSLLLGSTYADLLSDFAVPLGAPLTHIVHAFVLYIAALAVTIGLLLFLSWRAVERFSRKVSVGPTVNAIVDELAKGFDIRPEVRITGGVRGLDLTSLTSARVPTILVPANQLIEAKKRPDAFQFRLAHEFAHIAARDYISDVWIRSAYLVGGVFMVGAFGRVLWNTFQGLMVGGRAGVEGIMFALRGAALPLTTNTVSLGFLATLLFLEHRAAMRLREFHADAVASSATGTSEGAFWDMKSASFSGPKKWLHGLIGDHPDEAIRSMALATRDAALRADMIVLVIQGFFAATVVEMAMQLLLAGASVDVSSLAERQAHMLWQLDRYPETVYCIAGLTVMLCSVANYLVIRRVSVLHVPTGRRLRKFVQFTLLYGTGTLFALLGSQTFLWEMSEVGWEIPTWAAQDPERPFIYVIGIFGFAFAMVLAKLLWSRNASSVWAALGVCFLPSLLQISAAVWFLVPL